MKIKLKLGVSEQKKYLEVNPEELGYTDEEWIFMGQEEKQRIIIFFIDNLPKKPYWYLESFKTL